MSDSTIITVNQFTLMDLNPDEPHGLIDLSNGTTIKFDDLGIQIVEGEPVSWYELLEFLRSHNAPKLELDFVDGNSDLPHTCYTPIDMSNLLGHCEGDGHYSCSDCALRKPEDES